MRLAENPSFSFENITLGIVWSTKWEGVGAEGEATEAVIVAVREGAGRSMG